MKTIFGLVAGAVITLMIINHVPWYWFVIGGLVSIIGGLIYVFKDFGDIWG